MLLVFDARFSVALLAVLSVFAFGLALPLKIWRRTPQGFMPEVRISTLDLLQARALARSARAAEKQGDEEAAAAAWRLALANDPGDEKTGASFIAALLQSHSPGTLDEALRTARWFHQFSANTSILALSVAAAERAKAWRFVLELCGTPGGTAFPATRAKALFWTGDCEGASRALGDSGSCAEPAEYRLALDSILQSGAPAELAFAELQSRIRTKTPSTEEIEVFLQTCFLRRDCDSFGSALELLKRQPSQTTLHFEIFYAQMLLERGLRHQAQAVANGFSQPRSPQESVEAATMLARLGAKKEAIEMLRKQIEEPGGSLAPWLLYAQLQMERDGRDELRLVVNRLQRSLTPLDGFTAAIEVFVNPGEPSLRKLRAALAHFPRDRHALVWYFIASALGASGQAQFGTELLLEIEPHHARDPGFYDRLFASAERSRNSGVMRHAAERRYQLAPRDLIAAENYAAMLTIFEEDIPAALELAARCAAANPSPAAKINHAAALINAGQFGAADIILRKISAVALSESGRNQLRFVKLKRAVKLGLRTEASALASALDRHALYSRQIEWLAAQSL